MQRWLKIILGVVLCYVLFDKAYTYLLVNGFSAQILQELMIEEYSREIPVVRENTLTSNRLYPRFLLRNNQYEVVLGQSLRESNLFENDETLLLMLDLGFIYWHRGDQKTAISYWKQIAETQPNVLFFLMNAVSAKSDFYTLEDSKTTWEKIAEIGETVVTVRPHNIMYYVKLREIYTVKLTDPKQGIIWLNQAWLIDSNDWQVPWLLYADYITVGEFDLAQVFLEKAYYLDKNYQYRSEHEYYWRLGSVNLRQQKLDDATHWLITCLDIKPEYTDCLIELGESYYLQNNYDLAQQYFKRVQLNGLSPTRRDFVEERLTILSSQLEP